MPTPLRGFVPAGAVLLVTINAAAAISAQEPTRLEAVAMAQAPGVRVASANGPAGAAGRRYVVPDLQVTQPVVVYVSEVNFGKRVRVELAKFEDFLMPLRTCDTKPGDPCVIVTRTDGEAYIRVRPLGADTADYVVGVWIGEPRQDDLPSLFRPMPDNDAAPRPTTSPAGAVPTGAEQMTARFFAYDAARRVLVVKDGVGTAFEFQLPEEATLTVADKPVPAGEYLKTHFNNLPFAADQQLVIVWKPSADKKGRVAVSVK